MGQGTSPTAPELELRNPRTHEVDQRLRAHTPSEVADCVAEARMAEEGWAAWPVSERVHVLRTLCDRMIEEQEALAEAICHRIGKSKFEGLAEVALSVDSGAYFTQLALDLAPGRKIKVFPPGLRQARMHYRPLGTVAIISPWNYPLFLACHQIFPALAAGNTVIHKPSERCADVNVRFAELAWECGVPRSALQVILGGPECGQAILDAGVDLVHVTGSPATGRAVLRTAAESLTPVMLELGGKDAAIVCEDAFLERAARAIAFASCINAGQTCIAHKRAILHTQIYDQLAPRIVEEVRALAPQRIDNEPVGPLFLPNELNRITRQIEQSVAMGATLLCGGTQLDGPGTYFVPAVLGDCTPDMPAVKEETFAPLLCLMKADSDDEAIALSNQSDFGLCGSIWTRDKRRAERIASRLKVGSLSINDVLTTAYIPAAPFGGVKQSGFGRAGSELGFLNYCNVQTTCRTPALLERDPIWPPYSDTHLAIARKFIGSFHTRLGARLKWLSS